MKFLVKVAALAACLSSTLGRKNKRNDLLQRKLDCCANTAAWCVAKTVNRNMIKACQDGVKKEEPITDYMNPQKIKNWKPMQVCRKGPTKPCQGTTLSGKSDDPIPWETHWEFDSAEVMGFRVSCQSDAYESGDTYLAALVTDVGNCRQKSSYCSSMLNGYFIIVDTNESKNLDQLASRYFRVNSLQELRNSPYNMKISTFNWKGDDSTFRKGNYKTGISNFESNEGKPIQPDVFELAALYQLLDAWRNQKPYYKKKIHGKTVKMDKVQQAAKNDENYLKETDLFSIAQAANSNYQNNNGNNNNYQKNNGNNYYYQNNNGNNNNYQNNNGNNNYYQNNNGNNNNYQNSNGYYYYPNNNGNHNNYQNYDNYGNYY